MSTVRENQRRSKKLGNKVFQGCVKMWGKMKGKEGIVNRVRKRMIF